MQATQPLIKDIVLIGGGHSHALLIRKWGMQPTPGIRLTLVSPNIHTPYSGMLPGLIAEHYTFEETHIDLAQTCAWAGVRFIQDEVIGINAQQQSIHFTNRPNIEYDVCSVDIGSTPNQSICGSTEFAIGVKPIAEFYSHWQALQNQLKNHPTTATPLNIVIIGAGAGGIELITAMQFWAKKYQCNAAFHLINRADTLLSDSSSILQKKITQHLNKQDIRCSHNFDTQKIDGQYIYSEHTKIPYDKVFYCTQAAPATWLANTDIALNKQGFIKINKHLQSVSHHNLFAAGDIAHFTPQPVSKAGVYAVRMAPVLFENLVHYCLHKPLRIYKPQKNFLSLIALGGQYALGQRSPLSIWGKWVWIVKNNIDKKFMNLFHQLPDMVNQPAEKTRLPTHFKQLLNSEDSLAFNPRCGGCGGKISANILKDTISQLQPYEHSDVVMGLKSADDAAVFKVPNDSKIIQSLDHLKNCSSDPYLFGKISALHALSDLFAMHAQPHTAMALLQLPNGLAAIQRRDMLQLMQGAIAVLNEHQCALIGGHTSENADLQMGFCVNGIAQHELISKTGAKAGHVIILSKAIGTGVILAAHMQAKAKGEDVEQAMNSMLTSNASAAEIFYNHHASSLTDVTGFGLVGHLFEMIRNSNKQNPDEPITAQLELASIPALNGATALFKNGYKSTLHDKNQREQIYIHSPHTFQDNAHFPLLFDPQTSGGLLATVPFEHSRQCLIQLQQAGLTQACIVGQIAQASNESLLTLL